MLNIDLKLNRLAYFFIAALCFLYYYLGEMRVVVLIAYIVGIFFALNALRLATLRLTKHDVLILSLLILAVVYHLFTYVNVTALPFALRLNFGFLVFYYFFRSIERPHIESLTIVLSLATVFEYVLIRMFPFLIDVMPNYADKTFFYSQTQHITGGVHSFGGNRTVSSVILLSLFVYLENVNDKRRFRYLPLVASVLCFSGAGATLTFAYFIWKYRKKWILAPIVIILAAILTSTGEFSWGKFSIDYFPYLYDHKYAQILRAGDILGGDITNYLFGAGDSSFAKYSKEIAGYGSAFGDFLVLDFFVRFGILGMAIIFSLFVTSANKQTVLPILILFAGTFHYHVIFSTIGQLVLGYLLAAGSVGLVNQRVQGSRLNLLRF